MKAKTKYYIYRIGVDSLIILLFLFLYYKNYYNYELLIRALIIMSSLVIYKWIAIKIGLDYYHHHEQWLNANVKNEKTKEGTPMKIWFDMEKLNENKRRFVIIIKKILNSRIVKKYPIIMDIIYGIFRLLPGNIMYYAFLRIGVLFFDIKVGINSNKDVYYKKKNVNKCNNDGSLEQGSIYIIFRGVVVYPVLRLLLLLQKIRKRIFKYEGIIDLIRVRFVIYMYSLLYIYIGYYDLMTGMPGMYKICVILIFTGIVGPVYMNKRYVKGTELYEENRVFYFPSFGSFVLIKKTSVSLYIFSIYLEQVQIEKNSYLQMKYNFVGLMELEEVSSIFWLHKFSYYGKEGAYCDFGKDEKLYGISYNCYISLIMFNTTDFSKYYYVYCDGEKELGKKYVNEKYGKSLIKMKELYKCRQMFMMDVRRLLMFEKEKGMFGPEHEVIKDGNKDAYMKFIFRENDVYEAIPSNYMGFGLYKLIGKYSMTIMYIFIKEFDELDLKYGKNKNYLIVDIMKKVENIEEIDIYKYEDETKIIDYCNDNGDIDFKKYYNGIEYFNKLCKEIEEEYFVEGKKNPNRNRLVSEKYILEYMDKYVLK